MLEWIRVLIGMIKLKCSLAQQNAQINRYFDWFDHFLDIAAIVTSAAAPQRRSAASGHGVVVGDKRGDRRR
jgi:hypothetical protein